jgi:CubicO group peptidase (beta-lactamase class C family)
MNFMRNQSKSIWSKPAQQTTSLVLSVLLIWGATAYGIPSDQNSEINKLMGILYERGQFNGGILVARRGTILYRKAFGKANFQTGSDFRLETPSNIGSVTKQFTAMSIMILEERKKLSYDDPVSKYISEFSRSAHFSKITLRHLTFGANEE